MGGRSVMLRTMPKQCAVTLLLRSLNDVEALRVNRLTSRFFERTANDPTLEEIAAAQAQNAVFQALKAVSMGSGSSPTQAERRQAYALTRCDYEQLAHKQVADELGLSLRQFYRELGEGRRRFETALKRAAEKREAAKANVERIVDVSEIEQQRIRFLALNGHYADAIASAAYLENSASGDRDRARACLLHAEVLAEDGDPAAMERAGRRLMELPQKALPYSPGAMLTRLIGLRSRALFVAGDPVGAYASAKTLRAHPFIPATAQERTLCSLAFVQSAALRSLFGETHDVERDLVVARDLATDVSGPLVPLLRSKLGLIAAEALLLRHDVQRAKDLITTAWEQALSAGLGVTAIDAALTFAVAEMLDGNFAEACAITEKVLQRFEHLHVREEPWFIAGAAEIFAAAGQRTVALDLVRRYRDADSPHVARGWMRRAMEAQMLVDEGRFGEARTINEDAISFFRRSDMKRLLGFSLRIAALIDEQVGDRTAMRDHIVESVELLERFGQASSFAKSLELSARMTSNRRHARRAKEILTGRQ